MMMWKSKKNNSIIKYLLYYIIHILTYLKIIEVLYAGIISSYFHFYFVFYHTLEYHVCLFKMLCIK